MPINSVHLRIIVQTQSNPKLSYYENVHNCSVIFQTINNIIIVIIGIYTLTQIISHDYVEFKNTLSIWLLVSKPTNTRIVTQSIVFINGHVKMSKFKYFIE